jgi:ABC-type bacteriocin/lantibiotic exporter with double-glycine peptidase domain
MLKLAKVRPHQQETQRTCSAACLRAVLLHHGKDIPESVLSKAIGVAHYGAELYQIVGTARALGFRAKQVEFESMEAAFKYLRKDLPLICDVQSWTKKGSGHYVVLVSESGGRVNIMDPNVEGNWRTMSGGDFDKRWWDGDNVYRGRVLRRPAVIIEPR